MPEKINIELKARCVNISNVRNILISLNAFFKGEDHQTDTYFNIQNGRLKIREGTIENCLVYYERPNYLKPMKCCYDIIKFEPNDKTLESIKKILISSLGIKVIIEKKREIYFIGNVKFHLDSVNNLGNFLEIEAIGSEFDNEESLSGQCNEYILQLGIKEEDMIGLSYSDMFGK